MSITGEEWKRLHGHAFPDEMRECMAQGVQKIHDDCEAAKRFWDTASYEEKQHELLYSLAKTRCRHGIERRCNSCGPIYKALQMLKEGKL